MRRGRRSAGSALSASTKAPEGSDAPPAKPMTPLGPASTPGVARPCTASIAVIVEKAVPSSTVRPSLRRTPAAVRAAEAIAPASAAAATSQKWARAGAATASPPRALEHRPGDGGQHGDEQPGQHGVGAARHEPWNRPQRREVERGPAGASARRALRGRPRARRPRVVRRVLEVDGHEPGGRARRRGRELGTGQRVAAQRGPPVARRPGARARPPRPPPRRSRAARRRPGQRRAQARRAGRAYPRGRRTAASTGA